MYDQNLSSKELKPKKIIYDLLMRINVNKYKIAIDNIIINTLRDDFLNKPMGFNSITTLLQQPYFSKKFSNVFILLLL